MTNLLRRQHAAQDIDTVFVADNIPALLRLSLLSYHAPMVPKSTPLRKAILTPSRGFQFVSGACLGSLATLASG
ncbi:hypothetical protein KSC_060760 [Ktedonobacter sp. SOSP1-52]|nr:hypothetical protein KSC_060760 [Ktedonobacter sp. SOSP1-52]